MGYVFAVLAALAFAVGTVLQQKGTLSTSAGDKDPRFLIEILHKPDTGATLAAATGASTRELMNRLGHASSDAALRYQHATQNRDAAIATALSNLVQQPNGTT